MSDDFRIQFLDAACRKLTEKSDDPTSHEIVLRALAAFRPEAAADASPLVTDLTRMVWHYGEMLKFHLEQAKTGAVGPDQLERAASEVCRQLGYLKEAIKRDIKKKPAEAG